MVANLIGKSVMTQHKEKHPNLPRPPHGKDYRLAAKVLCTSARVKG